MLKIFKRELSQYFGHCVTGARNCTDLGYLRFRREVLKLFDAIDFETEAEAIRPENEEIAKESFRTFLRNMDWVLPERAFEDLLKQKSGENAFRKNGITPNWYHEFSHILLFLSSVSANSINYKILRQHGGVDTMITGLLYHDSWEDFGISPNDHYGQLEEMVHDLIDDGELQYQKDYISLRHKMAGAVEIIDLMSRQVPKRDADTGLLVREGGKIMKEARFKGDKGVFTTNLLHNILAVLGRYYDSIEGMATRKGVKAFNLASNQTYADERRQLFGRNGLNNRAIKAYPDFENMINQADSLLGIVSIAQENMNYYEANPNQNPLYAPPIDIDRFIQDVRNGFDHMPRWAHPARKQYEYFEKEALNNDNTRILLRQSIYPAVEPLIGKRNLDEKPTVGLQRAEASASTVEL